MLRRMSGAKVTSAGVVLSVLGTERTSINQTDRSRPVSLQATAPNADCDGTLCAPPTSSLAVPNKFPDPGAVVHEVTVTAVAYTGDRYGDG